MTGSRASDCDVRASAGVPATCEIVGPSAAIRRSTAVPSSPSGRENTTLGKASWREPNMNSPLITRRILDNHGFEMQSIRHIFKRGIQCFSDSVRKSWHLSGLPALWCQQQVWARIPGSEVLQMPNGIWRKTRPDQGRQRHFASSFTRGWATSIRTLTERPRPGTSRRYRSSHAPSPGRNSSSRRPGKARPHRRTTTTIGRQRRLTDISSKDAHA